MTRRGLSKRLIHITSPLADHQHHYFRPRLLFEGLKSQIILFLFQGDIAVPKITQNKVNCRAFSISDLGNIVCQIDNLIDSMYGLPIDSPHVASFNKRVVNSALDKVCYSNRKFIEKSQVFSAFPVMDILNL
jgi:hypothetical protein